MSAQAFEHDEEERRKDVSDNEDYLTAEEGSINESSGSFHRLKCHQTKGFRQRNQPLSATSLSSVIKIVEQCTQKVSEKSVRSGESSANRENPAKTEIFEEDHFFSNMSTAKDKVRSDSIAINCNPPSKSTAKITGKCRPPSKPNTPGPGAKEKQTSVKPDLVHKIRAPTILTDTANNKPKPMYSEVAATRTNVGHNKKGSTSQESSSAAHATADRARNTTTTASRQATQTMVGANKEEKERRAFGAAVDGAGKKVLQIREVPNTSTRNLLKTGKETKGPSPHLDHQVEGVERASSGKQPQANEPSTAAALNVTKQCERIIAKKKSVGSEEDKGKRHIPASQPGHSNGMAPNIGRKPTKYAQICTSFPVTSILVEAEPKSHVSSCQPRHPPGKPSNTDHKSTKYAQCTRLPVTRQSGPPEKVPKKTVSKAGKDVEHKSLPAEENSSAKVAESSQVDDGTVSSSTGFFNSIRNKVFGFFMPSKKENKVEEEMLFEEALPVKVSLEDDLCDASSPSTNPKTSGGTPNGGDAKLFPTYVTTQTGPLLSNESSAESKATVSADKDPGVPVLATPGKLQVRGAANVDSVLIMQSLKKDGLRPPKESLGAVRTQETVLQDCQQSSVVSDQGLRGKDMVPGLDASQKGTIVAEKKAHTRTRTRSQPATASTSTPSPKGTKGKAPLSKPQLITERPKNDPCTNKVLGDSSSSKVPTEKEKENCSLEVDEAQPTGEDAAHQNEGKDASLDSRRTEQSLVTSALHSLAATRCSKGRESGSDTTKHPKSDTGSAFKKETLSTVTAKGLCGLPDGISTTSEKLADIGKPGRKDISPGANSPISAGMSAAVSPLKAAAPASSTVPAKSETHFSYPKSEGRAPGSTDSSAVRSLSANSQTLSKTTVDDEAQNVTSFPPRSSHSSSEGDGLPIRVENSAAKDSPFVGNIAGHHAPVTEMTPGQGRDEGVNTPTSLCSNVRAQSHNPEVVDRVMAGFSSKAPDPINPTVSLGSDVSSVVSTMVSTTSKDASHNTRPTGVHPTYACVTSHHPLKHSGNVASKPKDEVKTENSQPCAMETKYDAAGTFAPKLTFIGSPAPTVCKPGLDVGTSRAESGKVKGPNPAEGGTSWEEPLEIAFPAWSKNGTRAPRLPPTETSPTETALNLTSQLQHDKQPFRQSEGVTDVAQQPTGTTENHQQQQKCIEGRNQFSFNASDAIPYHATAAQTSFPHHLSTAGMPPPVFETLAASYQANAHGMNIGCTEPTTLPTSGPPHERVTRTVGSEAPSVTEPKEKTWHHKVDVKGEGELRDTKHEEAEEEEEEEDEESSDDLEEANASCIDVRNRRKLRAKRRLQQQHLAGAKLEERQFQERAVQNQKGGKNEKQKMKTTVNKPMKGVDEKVVEAGKECKIRSQPCVAAKGAKSVSPAAAVAAATATAACKPPVAESGSGKKQKPIAVVPRVPGSKLDTSELAREDSGSKAVAQKSERKKQSTCVSRLSTNIQDQDQATGSTEVKRDRKNGNFDEDEANGKTVRKGNKNKNKRRVKIQGARGNVNFRKSINCCCETVCDLCVP